MSAQRILVVDDEPDIGALVKDTLEDEGFDVVLAQNAHDARAQFTAQPPDLVLLDIWMPDEDGISLLKSWQENATHHPPIVIMSGHGTVETAVEATRLGACSFIEKPLTTAKLLQSVQTALDRDNATVSQQPMTRAPVGASLAAKQLRDQITQLTHSDRGDTPISIVGESGTGKATLAEYIHHHGQHAAAPLITLLGSDLNKSSLEAALEDAAGGTLLIKQAHELLRGRQKNLIAHLSASRLASKHVRLMMTSPHPIAELSRRIGITPAVLEIATLREHVEDIPELVNACIDYWCQTRQLAYRRFSIAAQNYLLHYIWPGNLSELNELVRELLESGSSEEISLQEVEALFERWQSGDAWLEQALSCPLREAREMFERFYLQQQLKNVEGNISRLAVKVGMERSHLYRKLRALGIHLQDSGKQP